MLWSVRIATNSGGSSFIIGTPRDHAIVARAAVVGGALSRLAPHVALQSAINTMLYGSPARQSIPSNEPRIVLMADALTAVASIGDHR